MPEKKDKREIPEAFINQRSIQSIEKFLMMVQQSIKNTPEPSNLISNISNFRYFTCLDIPPTSKNNRT